MSFALSSTVWTESVTAAAFSMSIRVREITIRFRCFKETLSEAQASLFKSLREWAFWVSLRGGSCGFPLLITIPNRVWIV
jgi:hypothetical protein